MPLISVIRRGQRPVPFQLSSPSGGRSRVRDALRTVEVELVPFHPQQSPQLTLLPTKYNGSTSPSARSRARGVLRPWLVGLGLLLTSAPGLRAQWAVGPWDDATIAPRGVLRSGISIRWTRANERFARTGTNTEPLGADFSTDSLGPMRAVTATLVPSLETLTGLTSPALSLGRLRVDLEAMSWSIPIAFEYGLSSRLSLSLLVPYVKTRVEVFPNTRGAVGTATMGLNPAFTLAAARTQNGSVVTELQSAAATLQSRLATCNGSSDPTCAAINADRSGATSLVAGANAAATALAKVYGTSTVTGSPFAPAAQGVLQSAVDARLGAFSSDFALFLGAPTGSAWIAQRPVPAAPLSASDLKALVSDTTFGVEALPLGDIEHSHLGDVEFGAKAVLLASGVKASAGAPPKGLGVRLAVAGVFRAGTAQKDSPDNLVDIGTGDGQNDVEARAFLDVLAGRRWWVSVVARHAIQMKDRVRLRVPSVLGEAYTPATSSTEVNRDLGDYTELEVTPRFAPNAAFAFSGYYRLRTKGADKYSFLFDSNAMGPDVVTGLAPDVSLLGQGTAQTEQRLGFAFTYSTLRGYAFRRSPWPLEVTLLHTQAISGKGGLPKEYVTSVGIRLYRSPFGGDPMRATR